MNANTLACNGSPASGFRSSSKKITVQAGSTVTGLWLHELGSTDSNPGSDTDNKVIASSHKGPLLAYMKKVSDATQNPSAGPGNGWFKISEAGLISSNQWAVDALISAGGVQSVKIPSCIENGDYLLRFELIALHSASSYPGAQFYVCVTILHFAKYNLAWLTIQSLGRMCPNYSHWWYRHRNPVDRFNPWCLLGESTPILYATLFYSQFKFKTHPYTS